MELARYTRTGGFRGSYAVAWSYRFSAASERAGEIGCRDIHTVKRKG